jgi:TRAP-type C4-dicarboxylate transport system permease small subunit
MEQAIQILTIVIDVLLIFFVLLLIALAWKMMRMAKAFSGFIENLSDLKFWLSLLKSVPRSFHKSKPKE